MNDGTSSSHSLTTSYSLSRTKFINSSYFLAPAFVKTTRDKQA
ncbi:hypothetical protein [Candidatus Ichthyocystis hellenicum]|nr:hypothetical protein [Candidatus Ichthyocystis hellenicum]